MSVYIRLCYRFSRFSDELTQIQVDFENFRHLIPSLGSSITNKVDDVVKCIAQV